jgi:aerobic carbon-monoxide dehydrogenase large subunit
MTVDGIGVPLRRREDRRFLTGRGRYVHDIVRPQQLYAVFLRSPHAHAEIVAIDKTEALASPGVAAIFTAEDVAADKLNGVPCAWGIAGKDGKPMKEPPHPLLARDKVRHVGDPVATSWWGRNVELGEHIVR